MYKYSNKKLYFFTIASLLSVIVFVYIKFILEINIFSNEINSINNYISNDIIFFILILFLFTTLQIFFIPGSILTVVISVILNSYLTFILMFISGLITSIVQYKLASTANDNPRTNIQKKINNISNKIKDKGLLMIILVRIIPGIPFSTFNLTCGLLKIKFSHFIISFIFGIGPKILFYSNILYIFKKYNVF